MEEHVNVRLHLSVCTPTKQLPRALQAVARQCHLKSILSLCDRGGVFVFVSWFCWTPECIFVGGRLMSSRIKKLSGEVLTDNIIKEGVCYLMISFKECHYATSYCRR